MRVFLEPTGIMAGARAMQRVVAALKKYAPSNVEFVDDPRNADMQIVHVIDTVEPPDRDYVVIQYCGYVDRGNPAYQELWKNAKLVWSYYPLEDAVPATTPFMLAPLGIDDAFRKPFRSVARDLTIMTSGFVTGPKAEAIEEVALAVDATGGRMVHIGPNKIEGMTVYPPCFETQHGILDVTLAMLYRHTHLVSGLRQVEGFELPALEGMAQGARPVMFDRPDTRLWYNGRAEFIQPCHGPQLVQRLVELFKQPPNPVKPAEVQSVLEDFNWAKIAPVFWQALLSTRKAHVTVSSGQRRLLWIGDAVAATGFAKGTHEICHALMREFEVHILGLNYFGDPHDLPFKIYPAVPGGDGMGYGRTKQLVEQLAPAAVVLQNDPWNIQRYLTRIGVVPTIGYIAVDGKNCAGKQLNGLDKAIFWTEFGRTEAARGGYTGPSAVIPLGVDLNVYAPQDREDCRQRMKLPQVLAVRGMPENSFVVGVVGRNQWRKRLDLTVQYFAEWIQSRHITDACLWMHCAPTGDDAWDLDNLGRYYGVADRVMIPTLPRFKGIDERAMARIYGMCDCLFTTTMGEGMWLPGLEAAACGTPIIAPDWSAVGEIFKGASLLVPCTSTAAHPNQVCVIGGVMDKQAAMEALDKLYRDHQLRATLRDAGLALVQDPKFHWQTAGRAFLTEVLDTLNSQPVPVSEEALLGAT